MQKNYAEKVTKYLIENHLTISFMESCTSGLLASMFTDTEGASSVFSGSLITYSNDIKIKFGVDPLVIDKYGVYSSMCAEEMAKCVKKTFMTDIAIGITGTTGNVDPNNVDSVKGEAYFCVIFKDNVYDYHISIDTMEMKRKDIKQCYADEVYKELLLLLPVE